MNVGNDEIDIDGYSIEMCNRNRHGGGVQMYVKDGIKYTNITNMTSSSVESTWINIKHTGESLAVGVMYRPPSANAEYFSNMLDQLDHVHSEYDNVILLGDLNHNYVFGERLRANPLYQLEILNNMKQLVDVPTRETLNTSSLLDVIFTTNDQSHSTTGVYTIGLSDHYMIFTVYSNVHDRDGHHEKVLTFRNYKTFSTERFLNDLISLECLHDTDWCSSLLESKWYEFKNAFIKLSNEHAPIQCRRLKNKSNSWFDADILAMIYRRDYLKRKAIACKDRRLWQDYRSQRNAVTRVMRQRKRNYYDEKINESQSNPNKLWKVLNQLTGKQHRDEIPGDLNANEFNDYFTSVGSETVSHFNVSESDTLFWRGYNCVSRFEFMTIQPESINAQLYALGLSSKTDVLGFDSKLLCLSSDILTPIITKFANTSLETNCVLNDWKLSRVTPIYKGKGDVNDKGNYRPISVISHIAKIIEREIKHQMCIYLERNALITVDQSAYREGHNTQTALHKVLDDWYYNIADGLLTSVCSFDIKKCFDTINHSILFKKMEKYGFASDTADWFRSYLLNRQQLVSCHNKLSEKRQLNIGVPQGSVLGPILFLIYINDINMHVDLGACNLYADDTLVYCSANNINELQECTQKCVTAIKEWYDNNHLVINASKCSIMVVTTK